MAIHINRKIYKFIENVIPNFCWKISHKMNIALRKLSVNIIFNKNGVD